VIVNLRNRRVYRTLVLEGHQAKPGEEVHLFEIGNKFYLRTSPPEDAADDLGEVALF
jgi:hypothetical protein